MPDRASTANNTVSVRRFDKCIGILYFLPREKLPHETTKISWSLNELLLPDWEESTYGNWKRRRVHYLLKCARCELQRRIAPRLKRSMARPECLSWRTRWASMNRVPWPGSPTACRKRSVRPILTADMAVMTRQVPPASWHTKPVPVKSWFTNTRTMDVISKPVKSRDHTRLCLDWMKKKQKT